MQPMKPREAPFGTGQTWFEFFVLVEAAGIEPAPEDPGNPPKPLEDKDSRDAP